MSKVTNEAILQRLPSLGVESQESRLASVDAHLARVDLRLKAMDEGFAIARERLGRILESFIRDAGAFRGETPEDQEHRTEAGRGDERRPNNAQK